MTMLFETLKCNIVNILGDAARGRFQVIGYQRQRKAASEVLGCNRMVQVYFKTGNFPKSAGRNTGPVQHDITYFVGLTVAMPAKGNLSVINSDSATSAQVVKALTEFQEGADLADKSLDELAGIIYQILMDPRNFNMGFSKGTMANRWVNSIEKDDPPAQGEYVILTGVMPLTMRAEEQITGASLGLRSSVYDGVLDIDGDDVEKTGIEINT